jgi:CRISPR system Cascade subunit CasE
MYLSKLSFSNNSVRARRLIASPYQLHKAIMRAFPDASDSGTGRVLFRVDHGGESGNVYLLVQSEKKPDWQKAEWLLNSLAEPPQTKPLDLKLSKGQVLYFRLLANPTVKRRGGDNLPTKRLGLLREEDQLAWLKGKAEKGGFSLLSCSTTAKEMLKETKENGATKHRLSLLSVCFEGVLMVESPEAFLETVRSGIGSAKGLGFGLLSLAPLRG